LSYGVLGLSGSTTVCGTTRSYPRRTL